MKQIIFLLVFISIPSTIYCQNPSVIFSKQIGSATAELGYDVCFDKRGNTIFTGIFASSIQIGTTTLTSNGGYDCFITKLDSVGNLIWAKSFGGLSDDPAMAI